MHSGRRGSQTSASAARAANGGVAARRLFAQLAADCALLEELRVMDYSLLLGVHSRSAEGYTSTELVTDRVRPAARTMLLWYLTRV